MLLSKTEHKTFADFYKWQQNSHWLTLHNLVIVKLYVHGQRLLPDHLRTANELITRILENLNLRSDTREVLQKIQHALDEDINTLGIDIALGD